MNIVSVVFIAVNGVVRRGTLRSLLREHDFHIFDALTPICPLEQSLTVVAVTDPFEGVSTDGFLDGSSRIPIERIGRLLTSAVALGSPIYVMRAVVPVTSATNPNPTRDVPIAGRRVVSLEKLNLSEALLQNIVYEIS